MAARSNRTNAAFALILATIGALHFGVPTPTSASSPITLEMAGRGAHRVELQLPVLTKNSPRAPLAFLVPGEPEDSLVVEPLERLLLSKGIAVACLQTAARRSLDAANSGGAPTSPRFRDLAEDIVAGVAACRARPEIDTTHVGLVVIGDAVWPGVMADSLSSEMTSFVRLSCPEVPPVAQERWRLAVRAKSASLPDSTTRVLGDLQHRLLLGRATFEVGDNQPARAELGAAIDSARSRPDVQRAFQAGFLRAEMAALHSAPSTPPTSVALSPKWYEPAFDPAPWTCRSHTPTLAVFAGRDSLLYVEESANRLRESWDFCSGTVGEIIIVPNADHFLRQPANVKRGPRLRFASDVALRVANWIREHPRHVRK